MNTDRNGHVNVPALFFAAGSGNGCIKDSKIVQPVKPVPVRARLAGGWYEDRSHLFIDDSPQKPAESGAKDQ